LKVEGVVIDSSEDRDPLTYVHGSGQIISGLENKLLGMDAGQKRNITVTPEEGYGDRDPEAVHKVPRDAFDDGDAVKAGSIVRGAMSGQEFQAMVVAVDDKDVTLDMNHPLAGKTLEFDIEILAVEE
jgi:FKBP-type peptidyl-prolyl cis-trans isomerase SlyD